jgi:chemotaxis protein methyltransferase CheR
MQNAHIDDPLYERYRTLVRERCGLSYSERKRPDLTQAIMQTSRDSGVTDLEVLYAQLVSGSAVWDTLIMHLTIGETYFFRNQPQFTALRQSILPDLIQRRAMSRHLRMWSAGCATGEEPYSIAIALSELFRQHAGWQASVLATDINPAFLSRAQAAVYGAWSFRDTAQALRDSYFVPEQNRWRLKSEIRQMVRFARLNLAEPSYPSVTNGTCAMDLILCRNVTIYFDEATTREVVQRLYHALTPGGWLIVGHSEPQISVYRDFEVHNFPDTVVYRKPVNSPVFFAGQPALRPGFSAEGRTGTPLAPLVDRSDGVPSRTGLNHLGAARQSQSPAPGMPDKTGLLPSDVPAAQVPLATLLKQAQLDADQGNWLAAEALCATMLQRDPLLVLAHYLLAQIREQQGDLDAALAAYRRTLYLDRSFVMGTVGMGHIWRQKGRPSDAQRCYRNALAQLAQMSGSDRLPGGEHISTAELIESITQLMNSLREQQ